MSKPDFRKVLSTEPVHNYILDTLSRHLAAGEKVLWFLSGGSAIAIEVEVARQLAATRDLKIENLSVGLIDERYGDIGHSDSNWQQLEDAGFNLPGAKMLPVLIGKSLDQTAEEYENLLNKQLAEANYIIALAGIGADGHTLGIKPNSPSVDTDRLVIGYEWDDYIRITTTSKLIKQVDQLIVYASGVEKREQLSRLQEDVSPNEQPAQLLKLCKNLIIFSDQVDE